MAGFSYNGIGGVVLNPEKPKLPEGASEPPQENVELDEFFQRLPANFRWPKPSDEAVAAAVEAIQRLSGGSAVEAVLAESPTPAAGDVCAGCAGALPPGALFCVWCGLAKDASASGSPAPNAGAAAQHHYHHHYHHFVAGRDPASAPGPGDATPAAPRGKVQASATTGAGNSRAEVAVRQVVQDWAQACNIKHLDDVLELYAADATVIRASLPPVRSLPAIREFLFSLLEAGLGDVEMESLRTDVMGEVAIDLGRCKMLVPVAMGKRREERGKYLIVLARQPAGAWKIVADCWSSDTAVSPTIPSDPGRKIPEPPPVRKTR
jgi:ketosteroid isomerase-like protein